jgi:hypothetical protein
MRSLILGIIALTAVSASATVKADLCKSALLTLIDSARSSGYNKGLQAEIETLQKAAMIKQSGEMTPAEYVNMTLGDLKEQQKGLKQSLDSLYKQFVDECLGS